MLEQFKSLALAGLLLAPAAEAIARNRLGVPVSIDDTGSYVFDENLKSRLFFKLLSSKIVTYNVDGPDVLIMKFDRAGEDNDHVEVTYSWDQKFLMKRRYMCRSRRPAVCSSAIVRGAEQASRLLQF